MARLRQAPEDRITIGHQDDDSLVRLEKSYRRDLEDVEDGTKVLPPPRVKVLRVKHRDIVREQELRAALGHSWFAVDRGCDSYTDFMTAGGLPAVVSGGGRPISYALAIELDRAMFLAGHPHALDWPDRELAGSQQPGGPLVSPADDTREA